MNVRPGVIAVFGMLTISAFALSPLSAEPADAPTAALVPVLEEFDGAHPNGKWEIHQYRGTFEYRVQPEAMEMIDQRNANQHVTRRGFQVDPKRRYAVETLFTIHERTIDRGPNSFCLNFNVAGPEDSFDSISCWSMNVDVAPGGSSGGVMKYMGFADGRFKEIGQRRVPWSRPGVEYLLRVEVNTDADGQYKFKTFTVTVMEGDERRERFEVDYSSFPYQPDFSKPVRIGVNTHGADWTMRKLKVYAEKPGHAGNYFGDCPDFRESENGTVPFRNA
jgi:hypothetical protein